MQRFNLLLMGVIFFVLWRALAAWGYPEASALVSAGATVFALAVIHAYLSRNATMHPATVIAALAVGVLMLAACVVVLSSLHPAALLVLIIVLAVPVVLYSRRERG